MKLVDQLRDVEVESLRSELQAGRKDHILKTLDERGGAQELIRQQYSGRYPFELLQNANDAAAEAGHPGRALYVLTSEALLVADNGTGFHETQIRAICTLGRSSKEPGRSVGYKGGQVSRSGTARRAPTEHKLAPWIDSQARPPW